MSFPRVVWNAALDTARRLRVVETRAGRFSCEALDGHDATGVERWKSVVGDWITTALADHIGEIAARTADTAHLTKSERIARVCHEANRALCLANGDTGQLPWEQAPEWQRRSAINGVTYALSTPTMAPYQMHDAWVLEKRAAGWSYGRHKDEEAKTHPCLVPWHELPREECVKDYVFLAIVRALA